MSEFAKRGVGSRLLTTEEAELDVALFCIPDGVMETIGRNLKAVTHSPRDREVGALRVREIAGFDVVFLHAIVNDVFTIMIGSIRLPDPQDPTERKLQALELMATIRGAFGL